MAADLSLPEHPEVSVAGDLASLNLASGPVPGIAPAAKQMGNYIARLIAARASGRTLPGPFSHRSFGLLATIGRMAAVVDLGKVRFSGFLAWWFWLLAHIFFLIGFRNRLVVLIDWAGAYGTYHRGARIIVRGAQE